MIKKILAAAMVASAIASANPALAAEREIPQSALKGGLNLKVSPGLGLVISFIDSGEIVYKAWLSDPSQIVFDADGGLCPKEQSDCNGTGSQVLFLRVIDPLDIEGMPRAGDRSTVLTLLSKKGTTTNLYQFRLSSGASDINLIKVVPDREAAW